MKKKRNLIMALIVAVLMTAALAACSSVADTSIGPKGATYNLHGLSQGKFLENTVKFNFDEGIIKADLESGTVDIQIVNIVPDDAEGDTYTEMDTIYDGKGLAAGDEVEISGVKTDIVIRVYGDNATGKLTISPKQ